jgi:hypothetical protein
MHATYKNASAALPLEACFLDRAWTVRRAGDTQSSYFAADGVQHCLMIESLLFYLSPATRAISYIWKKHIGDTGLGLSGLLKLHILNISSCTTLLINLSAYFQICQDHSVVLLLQGFNASLKNPCHFPNPAICLCTIEPKLYS